MQDKWRKAVHCTERAETSTESGWRGRSMQDKWSTVRRELRHQQSLDGEDRACKTNGELYGES